MTSHCSLVRRSARLFGFEGLLVMIDLPEGPVTVAVTVDEREHARRLESGLGAIIDWQLVVALWELPHGLSIAVSGIPGWASPRLARAEAGIVAADGSRLERIACPPLVVSGVVAVGRKFERLLQRVGQLSAIAPMGVVIQRAVDEDDPGLLEANLYGVGVGCSASGEITRVSEPEPVVPMPGPFLWWVAELAYGRLIEGTTSVPMLPPAA